MVPSMVKVVVLVIPLRVALICAVPDPAPADKATLNASVSLLFPGRLTDAGTLTEGLSQVRATV